MFAVDTPSFVAFLAGDAATDVRLIVNALEGEVLFMPPVVVAELMSARNMSDDVRNMIESFPILDIPAGYWSEVGRHRAELANKGHNVPLAKAMIATLCILNKCPLITRKRDYSLFVEQFGLDVLGE